MGRYSFAIWNHSGWQIPEFTSFFLIFIGITYNGWSPAKAAATIDKLTSPRWYSCTCVWLFVGVGFPPCSYQSLFSQAKNNSSIFCRGGGTRKEIVFAFV